MDDAFRYQVAARWLGIPYTQIDDTPEIILETAFQNWDALRAADMRLKAL